ncbi:hypothetical protein [Caulobacter endophyticus]|uniref:hypothetical protein n=1 Tax=Caulobacter endophyticus TaxID=2172652 RepID=UPI0011B2448B|nr:hypothetical protein [Caulobacter endophyticus]
MRAIAFIERRYGLGEGELRRLLPYQRRGYYGHQLPGLTASERRRISSHLPEDFNDRPVTEQDQIISWVRTVILGGSTPYRRYQRNAQSFAYAVGFSAEACDTSMPYSLKPKKFEPHFTVGVDRVPAPAALDAEMADLLRFKASEITPLRLNRSGVWGEASVQQRAAHIGLLFGALTAHPDGPAKGLGVPLEKISFAMLAHPGIWAWYLQWRRARRGFLTLWEADMLLLGGALTREPTGWLRQSPHLAGRMPEVPNIITREDVSRAQADWEAYCDQACAKLCAWASDVKRVAKIHRDPFEAILPVLESDTPVQVYARIPAEVLRTLPDRRRYPVAAAEATRSCLMLKLGLHTGLRQRNLRELRASKRGAKPTPMTQLESLRCGELGWDEDKNGWTIRIPAAAFKNGRSSYFADRPYILRLPDTGGLYTHIELYLAKHRAVLLSTASDPGTLFVKTVKRLTTKDASYDSTTFYMAWREVVQRYGVFNPYTGKGAIKGLLPHGPHNVRDILATHILKRTGSFEQAGYAIQDTAATVARHYSRFLPGDKAAFISRLLETDWATP